MINPSRRGLFALLAGAAVAPMLGPLVPDAKSPGMWRYSPWREVVPPGYAVTREVLEDNLYAEATAAEVSARVAEVFNRNRMTEGLHA